MVKKLVDYHLHTGEPFADQAHPHAKGSWREYFKKAAQIEVILNGEKYYLIPGNANHTPHYFGLADGKNLYPYERAGEIREDKLWEKFLEVNLNFRDVCEDALLGLEVDFYDNISVDEQIFAISQGYLNFHEKDEFKLSERLKKRFFDYLILSCHFVSGRGIDFSREEYELLLEEAGSDEKIIGNYWENLIRMTELGKNLKKDLDLQKLIFGHADLIKIINKWKEKPVDVYSGYEDLIEEFLGKLKEYELSLEYNTAGIIKGVGAYPDDQILKRALELEIDITFGSDSHAPYEDLNLDELGLIISGKF